MPALLLVIALCSLSFSSQKLFDFSTEDSSRWLTVHDSVMGGRSNGKVQRTDQNSLLFQGNLSLENNGGFASFRSADRDLTFAESDGIEIKVLGDGRTYICSLERKGVNLFGGGYWQEFETREGAWTVVRLPWSQFEAFSFGKKMENMPELTAETARSIGVYLYDMTPGPFRVEFDAISTYVDEVVPSAFDAQRASALSSTEIVKPVDSGSQERTLDSFLDQVVSYGVRDFNSGKVEDCAARYRQALEAVLALTPVSQSKATAIEIALVRSEGQDARTAAWTLRSAIDQLRQG